MRPTRGVALAVVAAVALHGLSRITGGAWLALASAAVLVLPVAALALRPRLSGVVVEPAPVRCRVGDVVEQRVVVRCTGRRASPPLRLTDRTAGLAPVLVAVPALRPGDSAVVVLRRTAVSRCSLGEAAVELSSAAPFGLVRVAVELAVPTRVVIAPRAVAAVPVSRGGLRVSSADGTPTGVAGPGTEVLGLRPWRAGDGATAVHARSTARHGRPVVLERERESGSSWVLVCARAGDGPDGEREVERACAAAEEGLRSGSAPALVRSGSPTVARPDLAALLAWHAALDSGPGAPEDPSVVARALREARRGGSVVVVGAVPPGLAAAAAAAGVTLGSLR